MQLAPKGAAGKRVSNAPSAPSPVRSTTRSVRAKNDPHWLPEVETPKHRSRRGKKGMDAGELQPYSRPLRLT